MSEEELREKVIKAMECCAVGAECDHCPYSPMNRSGHEGCYQMHADALDMLRAQEPRVMTLEELRRMHPVWASNTPPYLWLDINRDCINVVSHWVAWSDVKEMIYGVYPKYDPDNYGKTWRCWTSCPTDEQRKETPWETGTANGEK